MQYYSKKKLILPEGFFIDSVEIPPPKSINQLLASCSSDFFPNEKLLKAIQRSNFFFTIFSKPKNKIHGFVRVTSDKGLNANLWNLCAQPGKNQNLFYLVLLRLTLEKINREMPGCSISVQAPQSSFDSLKDIGFVLDPNGIRVMGLRL